jgi:hypothetical protein
MKKNIISILFFLCLLLSVPEDGLAKEASENRLKVIRTALTNGDDEESYSHFTPQNLYDLIDGGAGVYIDAGLVQGFQQRVQQDSSVVLDIMVMQMKNSRKAKGLHNDQKGKNADCSTLGQASDITVCHEESAGGVFSVTFLGNYYIEITILGVENTHAGIELSNEVFNRIYKAASLSE